MRKRASMWVVLTLALLAVACEPQPAIFPLYITTDQTLDANLAGEWLIQSGDEKQTTGKLGTMILAFAADGKSYDLALPDLDEEKHELLSTARLVPLGKFLFIDLEAPDTDRRKLKSIPYPYIAGHAFGLIHIAKDQVRMDFLSDQWVREQQKAGTLGLSALQTPGELVLTAPTEELRKFALEHASDAAAFSETFTMTRKK